MKDHLSLTFSALADPTRRKLLAHLSRGEASVNELASPLLHEMSLPAVTKHLQVLVKAGLITKSKDAQFRPCKINGAPIKEAVDWMEQYREFWEASFDRLEDYLKTMSTTKNKSKGKTNGRKKQSK